MSNREPDSAEHGAHTSHELPDWVPEEYDPDAPLSERLPIIAQMDGGVELHVRGENGTVEIVGQPQHHTETSRVQKLFAGTSADDWEWEIVVRKQDGIEPYLEQVNPMQDWGAYEATKRLWLSNIDVRIYGVDVESHFEEGAA